MIAMVLTQFSLCINFNFLYFQSDFAFWIFADLLVSMVIFTSPNACFFVNENLRLFD